MVLSKKGDILHFLVLLSHVDRIFFFTFSEIKGFFFFFSKLFLHALHLSSCSLYNCLYNSVSIVWGRNSIAFATVVPRTYFQRQLLTVFIMKCIWKKNGII